MNIPGLDIKSQYKGQTRYEGAVLTVSAVSKYNDTQIAFTEIDGFWQLPESYHNRKPPIGTVAKFFLKTKPKVNDPSKFYMDIEGIEKADGEPIAQQPGGDYVEKRTASTDSDGIVGGDKFDAGQRLSVDQRIAKAQAWNGLTAMLAAHGARGGTLADEQLDEMWTEWHEGYTLLKAGLTPFTQAPETDWDNPAEELDQQAAQHLSEQQPEFQSTPEDNAAQQPTWEAQGAGVQEETVERLPWD